LGHVTRKIVSEMAYNVSSGALNSTMPYHLLTIVWSWPLTCWPHSWSFRALAPWISCPNWRQSEFIHFQISASEVWWQLNGRTDEQTARSTT